MSEATEPVFCVKCDDRMNRDFQADMGKQTHGDCWGYASYAAGVSPSEVPAMREVDRRAGVITDYSPDGDPIMRSRAHRKKYLAAHGLHDRNGGYSD
jgi:hypothetical protein